MDLKWEGRCWIDNDRRENQSGYRHAFTFMSYHMLADRKCVALVHTLNKNWAERKHLLLNEIRQYDMDILCLQDVDHYAEWWQPQLMHLGYDSVWKQRTAQEQEHHEGVVIAYKRNLFQLFKTVPIELNRAADAETMQIRKQCYTDDVALIAFLQPWPNHYLKTALCVCCAMLSEIPTTGNPEDADVKQYQSKYISRSIEIANKDFQLPVVLGISMNDEPSSTSYHVFRTGRVPMMPQVPRRLKKPRAEQFSRGSVRLFWEPPFLDVADPMVQAYKITWRPGGSTILGFANAVVVPAAGCTQFFYVTGADGKRRSETMKERCVLIPGLACDLTYEFKICAINELGEGQFSEPSDPYTINEPKPNMKNVTKIPPLKYLHGFNGVLAVREGEEMAAEDWDTNLATQNTHVDSLTQLTPRTLEGSVELEITTGRVLPYSTNPREGWRGDLKGGTAAGLVEDHCDLRRIDKSIILDYDGFLPSVSMDRLSKRASFDVGALSSASRPSSNDPHNLLPPMSEIGDNPNAVLFQNTSFHIEVEENPPMVFSHDSESKEPPVNGDEDDDPAWDESPAQSRPESKELSREDVFSTGEPEEDDMNVDIFRTESVPLESPMKGKTGIFKGGSFNKGSGISPMGSITDRPSYHESFNMEDIIEGDREDDGSVFSLTNANPNFQSTNKEMITAIQQAAMNSVSTPASVMDMPTKLEKSQSFVFANEGVGPEGDFARFIDDDVILDGSAIMKKIGKPNHRNVHILNLRSAYENYSSGGEPLFTQSMPTATGGSGAICTDYIFFSSNSLVASRVLSLPPLSQLRGDDPRQPVAVLDSNWSSPPPALEPYYNKHNIFGVDHDVLITGKGATAAAVKQATSKIKSQLSSILTAGADTTPVYGGFWSYFSSYNPLRTHSWLPNEQFGSSHIAICAEIFVYDDYIAIEWM